MKKVWFWILVAIVISAIVVSVYVSLNDSDEVYWRYHEKIRDAEVEVGLT